MPTTSIGDADLYYEEAGQGPPVMLVPGLGGQGNFWAQQVKDFARDFRVIVHDHRGTGASTHSRIRYSVEQMADDVITPRFFSDELAERIPGAKLVVLDGGGHYAPACLPAPYNAEVGAFLRGQIGR